MFEYQGVNTDFFPSVGLKLTGECRLQCPFCCEPNRTQSTYSIHEFMHIVNILHDHGTQRLCLTGGDPLLYPDLLSFVKYSHELGMKNLLLTSDGKLLKTVYHELLPYISAIRFSVHDIGRSHNEIVQSNYAFESIEDMMNILKGNEFPYYITTVITKYNQHKLADIARWCYDHGVDHWYLFGLMRSGKGKKFIEFNGDVDNDLVINSISEIKSEFKNKMKIVHYDYQKSGECILIYGDGRVVIDPYPDHPTYQKEIGNILKDSISDIVEELKKDNDSYSGYCAHLKTTPNI